MRGSHSELAQTSYLPSVRSPAFGHNPGRVYWDTTKRVLRVGLVVLRGSTCEGRGLAVANVGSFRKLEIPVVFGFRARLMMSLRRVYTPFRSVRVHINFELRFGRTCRLSFPRSCTIIYIMYLGLYPQIPDTYTATPRAESDYIVGLSATRPCKGIGICTRPQQTRLFSSYTAARKFLSGCEEGIGVLTLSMDQVGKSEWTGPHWPVAAAVL